MDRMPDKLNKNETKIKVTSSVETSTQAVSYNPKVYDEPILIQIQLSPPQMLQKRYHRYHPFILPIASAFTAILLLILVCSILPSVNGGCHKKKIIYKKIKIKLPFLATKKVKVVEKFKVPFQVLVAVPVYFKFPIKVCINLFGAI